jgi:hypothetical protein
MEPVDITSPKALQQRVAADGIITITRGTFDTPTAHLPDCPAVMRIGIPTRGLAKGGRRTVERGDHPRSPQVPALPAAPQLPLPISSALRRSLLRARGSPTQRVGWCQCT